MKKQKQNSTIRQWLLLTGCCLMGVLHSGRTELVEASMLGGPSHIGTFEGSTTFTTSSSNGINPGLYLEVMDEYGNYTEYTSEEGVITIPGTKEGAYVTQAKLLGKTKYRDQDTGELLDDWEAGRNLSLESVENPRLTTVGKNLFDTNRILEREYANLDMVNGVKWVDFNNNGNTYKYEILSKPNSRYTLTYQGKSDDDSWGIRPVIFYSDGTVTYGNYSGNGEIRTLTSEVNKTVTHVAFDIPWFHQRKNTKLCLDSLQFEENAKATSYEPYQSNLLTVNENVELRGIGEVCDTLDLITGEVVENIEEFDLLNMTWRVHDVRENTIRFTTLVKFNKLNQIISNFVVKPNNEWRLDTVGAENGINDLNISVRRIDLVSEDETGVKRFIRENSVQVQGVKKTGVLKSIHLNFTYYFKPVNTRAVYVDGTVIPLVCSVTVPTEPLSFVLNPNEEPGKQFIAPEFTIENNNPASLSVSLKEFKQVTTVFNDVLPNHHQDWSQLDQEQSKDLALALVPKASEGWKQLNEGPRYVVDSTNEEIGEIKPKASVDFTFSASHGPAFTQALSPRYRLVFVFDF